MGRPSSVTQSNSENFSGLIAILVLSIVLVSGLLVWHPWTSTTAGDSVPVTTPAYTETTLT